jgi:hypothetical protein
MRCKRFEMSEQKRKRTAALAARTRQRNIDLRGPPIRRGACEVENERIDRGRRTLSDAFCGVPSRANFLKQADLFEFVGVTRRVDRAFIVPDGLDTTLENPVCVYWYRRCSIVSLPSKGSVFRVTAANGSKYDVTAIENVAPEWRVKLKGTTHGRTCTGAFLARISITT